MVSVAGAVASCGAVLLQWAEAGLLLPHWMTCCNISYFCRRILKLIDRENIIPRVAEYG